MPQESAIFDAPHGKIRAFVAKALSVFGKTGAVGIGAYEAWGWFYAGPILYGLAQTSQAMAIWVSFCVAVGLALSIVVPLWIARKLS